VIFISYSWQDRPTAALLSHLFDQQGVPHWVDSKQLDLRRPLRPQILAALLRASAVAYLDTSASRVSPWVSFELSQAHACSIPVIAIASRSRLRGSDILAVKDLPALNAQRTLPLDLAS
jgi:hypothetical protein